MEIFVATDLWGVKDNVRLRFPSPTTPPTVEELSDVIERTYQTEAIARCPPHISHRDVPRFRIAHLQILRPATRFEPERWEAVVTPLQLHDRCQLFVFQPPHPFHSDVRALIPQPRDVGIEAPHLSPRRNKLTPLDRAHMAFRLLDRAQRDVVVVSELREVLDALGLDISLVTATGPINFADPSKRFITFREWLAFADACPNVVALIVSRLGGASGEAVPERPVDRSRDLSPPRVRLTSTDRQESVCARLSSGLASIATKKDRQQELAAAAAARTIVEINPELAEKLASPDPRIGSAAARRGARTPSRSRTPKRAATPTLVQPRWNVTLK